LPGPNCPAQAVSGRVGIVRDVPIPSFGAGYSVADRHAELPRAAGGIVCYTCDGTYPGYSDEYGEQPLDDDDYFDTQDPGTHGPGTQGPGTQDPDDEIEWPWNIPIPTPVPEDSFVPMPPDEPDPTMPPDYFNPLPDPPPYDPPGEIYVPAPPDEHPPADYGV